VNRSLKVIATLLTLFQETLTRWGLKTVWQILTEQMSLRDKMTHQLFHKSIFHGVRNKID